MTFEKLEKSPIRDKYFARTEQWDWISDEMIHVQDSKQARMITLDPWPQIIYLDAVGNLTVQEYVHQFSKKYPKNQVPKELAETMLEVLSNLVENEKIIELSDDPIPLHSSILDSMTEEGEVDLMGKWKGAYTYYLPEELKDTSMQEVNFTIQINEVKRNQFWGTVEDDLNSGGTPGIGEIRGKFNQNKLWFHKNMPIYTTVDQNFNQIVDQSKKHPTLHYEGQFSPSKMIAIGTWKFKKQLFWQGIIPRWFSAGSGYFRMSKVTLKNESSKT